MRWVEGRLETEGRTSATLPRLDAEIRKLRQDLEEVARDVYDLERRSIGNREVADAAEMASSGQRDDGSSARPAKGTSAIEHTVSDTVPVPATVTRRPVDLDGGWLVSSNSLAAVGWLTPETSAPGRATVVLNEDVAIDHLALKKWAQVFDFRGNRAYVRYRTLEPAHVEWDEAAGKGRPLSTGVAEALE